MILKSRMICCRETRSPDTPWSWVVCVAATLNTFIHYGFSLSFGVFLPVLSEYFHENREKTAWVGSIAIALTVFTSLFAVQLINRFGHRASAMGGGLMCAVSLVSSSFVNNMKLLYITYGVLYGVGAGIIFTSCFTLNNLYFKKNPAFPTGIIATGSSLGVIAFGPCLEELIEAFQWRNTFRIIAGFMLLICLFSTTFDPVKTHFSAESEAVIDDSTEKSRLNIGKILALFTNCTYTIGLITIVLVFLSIYIPYIHLVQFAKDMKISSRDSSKLFIYLGVSSSVARVVIGRVLDKGWLRPLRVLQLMSLLIGLSIIFLAFAKEHSHFVIFSIVYGLANGGFMTNAIVFLLTVSGRENGHISFGIGSLFSSIAVCGGPPLAGFIADELGSYIPSFYICGGIATFAAILPFVLIFCDRKQKDIYRIEVKIPQGSDDQNGISSCSKIISTV